MDFCFDYAYSGTVSLCDYDFQEIADYYYERASRYMPKATEEEILIEAVNLWIDEADFDSGVEQTACYDHTVEIAKEAQKRM